MLLTISALYKFCHVPRIFSYLQLNFIIISQNNKSIYLNAVDILLKQIKKESSQSFLWLVSAINKSLLEHKNITIFEFKNLNKKSCADSFHAFKITMQEKERHMVD